MVGFTPSLSASRVGARVDMLRSLGPALGRPHSSDIKSSRHGRMRELRVQVSGRQIRVFYAFDPRRIIVLLLAGDKVGNDRSYEEYVPRADICTIGM